MINSFKGPYEFLSNFYLCEVEYEGVVYPSVEHAFVAAKTFDLEDRKKVFNLTPGQAKILGRTKFKLRDDWEEVRLPIMEELLLKKFSIPRLKTWLIKTRDAELIEGNWWGDEFWGICRGKGENHLGKLLMKIRSLCSNMETSHQFDRWYDNQDPELRHTPDESLVREAFEAGKKIALQILTTPRHVVESCEHCGCALAKEFGGLEKHSADCPNLSL